MTSAKVIYSYGSNNQGAFDLAVKEKHWLLISSFNMYLTILLTKINIAISAQVLRKFSMVMSPCN